MAAGRSSAAAGWRRAAPSRTVLRQLLTLAALAIVVATPLLAAARYHRRVAVAVEQALRAVDAALDVRPDPAAAPVTLVVDADRPVGRVRPIWDEVNLWKLHLVFGTPDDPARWWGPGWLAARAPWVRYARVLAALGGNYATAVAPWCDHGTAAPAHPQPNGGECGRDGVPGAAAANELARREGAGAAIDYAPFRTAVARLLGSGVRPHLNLSAAPEVFTGGSVDFSHYHWNAAPVRDLDGWRRFVAGAFGAVADLDPRGWRVSITNEPNCLTLVGWEQHRQHVGFSGTPGEYGALFAATAATVRAAAPGARLHAGNYVTSATFPGENNLAVYLAALRHALAVEDGVRWPELDAVSLSLYETDDTTVYDLVPVRLRRLAAAQHAAGLPPLPVKVDELDVHPVLVDRFRGPQPLDTTLYAASWHAEALRAFVAAGNVVSVAPWLDRMFDRATWTAYPKADVYGLFGVLAGELRAADGARVTFTRTGRRGGLVRVAVAGERSPAPDPLLHPERAVSLRALATRSSEALRVLAIHHANAPRPDAPAARRRARAVAITARGLAPGAYAVRHLAIGTADGSAWRPSGGTPLAWVRDGCREGRAGELAIASTHLPVNSVVLYEVVRLGRTCP